MPASRSEELIVHANLENMLFGTDVLGLVGSQTTRAGCCEDNVLGTETQIVVFKLGGPVIGEGIFQTQTNQQAIERGGALSERADAAAEVHLRRVPVKRAGYLSRLAVNQGSVKERYQAARQRRNPICS